MDRQRFIAAVTEALGKISEPRLFKNERGFQGELLAALRSRLQEAKFHGDPIIEQEHQKRVRHHGINIRPDLIIHIPFDRGVTERRSDGNFVAIELKRNEKDVVAAFENLRQLKERLDYPLTILVMIDSMKTYADLCPESIADQTVCFAVRLEDGAPLVKIAQCPTMNGKPLVDSARRQTVSASRRTVPRPLLPLP